MRMWGVNPKCLCRHHLLGEHVEMHMFAGVLKKGISIQGYLDKKLVIVNKIEERHNVLAKEMKKRGFNHNSNLICNTQKDKRGSIDIQNNKKVLTNRCKQCKTRFKLYNNDIK